MEGEVETRSALYFYYLDQLRQPLRYRMPKNKQNNLNNNEAYTIQFCIEEKL